MSEEVKGYEKLNLRGAIGFNGTVDNCLQIHPDRQNYIYALGSAVVIEDIISHQQSLLQGHSNSIVCLAVSRDGCYLASGQITHMGYKADIILWDYAEKKEITRFISHSVKVQALAFSPNAKYLVSIGGQDDGSVILWSVENLAAICGSSAQFNNAGITRCITYSNNNENMFFTGGDSILRIWQADIQNRKIHPTDCSLRQYKRTITKVLADRNDEMLYCATTSGDILAVRIGSAIVQLVFPDRDKYSLGVTSLRFLDDTSLIIGTGEGWDDSCIRGFFPETGRLMYTVNEAHKKGVTAVAAMDGGSRIISGGGEGQVRVWEVKEIPATCKKKIAAHRHRSHRCQGDRRGNEEDDRPKFFVDLLATLKEHTNAVSCIQINKNGTKCVSSSADGTCIIWNLVQVNRVIYIYIYIYT
ncbi:unnamed protein product [Rodentolepis nana]|uniref:Cilia- and flagella-associated protein 52 n=1 Tax=Rodentolepis nana TaxID=102285 RepID=A0A158QJF0_RODNA|nr:unnamed protein product [Rodentolepis nana]